MYGVMISFHCNSHYKHRNSVFFSYHNHSILIWLKYLFHFWVCYPPLGDLVFAIHCSSSIMSCEAHNYRQAVLCSKDIQVRLGASLNMGSGMVSRNGQRTQN